METENKLNVLNCNTENIITRMPRLDTVIMVENFIKEHNGDLKKQNFSTGFQKK